VPKLLGVFQLLRAAPAAHGDVGAPPLDPGRRRAEDPLGARLGVLALSPIDGRQDAIARKSSLEEDDEPLHARQGAPAEG
jgi:hypothetical protein